MKIGVLYFTRNKWFYHTHEIGGGGRPLNMQSGKVGDAVILVDCAETHNSWKRCLFLTPIGLRWITTDFFNQESPYESTDENKNGSASL